MHALSSFAIFTVFSVIKVAFGCHSGMCFFGKQKHVAAISCLKRAAYLGKLTATAGLSWLFFEALTDLICRTL